VRLSCSHNCTTVRQPSQPALLDLRLLSFGLLYFRLAIL
jgi:hypothetical protein